MLEVTVYTDLADKDNDGRVFDDIEYVSLVTDQTYGPPALVAPERGQRPTAQVEDRVLYLNIRFIPAFEIVRTS